MMKKRMWFTTGIYIFCALIWAVNFILHWHQDGALTFSTALFGLAAVCFAIAAVGGFIALRKLKEKKED